MPLPALALPLAVLLPRRRPLGLARIIERGIEGVGREMIAFQQAGGLLADAAVQLPAGVESSMRQELMDLMKQLAAKSPSSCTASSGDG